MILLKDTFHLESQYEQLLFILLFTQIITLPPKRQLLTFAIEVHRSCNNWLYFARILVILILHDKQVNGQHLCSTFRARLW